MLKQLLTVTVLFSLFLPGMADAVEVPDGNNTGRLLNSNYDRHQQELLNLINDIRKQENLTSLRFSTHLTTAAQNHVRDLTQNNIFSHKGSDGSSVSERVLTIGYDYSSVGENIAAGHNTPDKVFAQWLNSPGHKENMLAPNYTEVGIGYVVDATNTTYGHYWVLVLGSSF